VEECIVVVDSSVSSPPPHHTLLVLLSRALRQARSILSCYFAGHYCSWSCISVHFQLCTLVVAVSSTTGCRRFGSIPTTHPQPNGQRALPIAPRWSNSYYHCHHYRHHVYFCDTLSCRNGSPRSRYVSQTSSSRQASIGIVLPVRRL
jgi:hypothetical protein